jgi:hypothetical protein
VNLSEIGCEDVDSVRREGPCATGYRVCFLVSVCMNTVTFGMVHFLLLQLLACDMHASSWANYHVDCRTRNIPDGTVNKKPRLLLVTCSDLTEKNVKRKVCGANLYSADDT